MSEANGNYWYRADLHMEQSRLRALTDWFQNNLEFEVINPESKIYANLELLGTHSVNVDLADFSLLPDDMEAIFREFALPGSSFCYDDTNNAEYVSFHVTPEGPLWFSDTASDIFYRQYQQAKEVSGAQEADLQEEIEEALDEDIEAPFDEIEEEL